MKTIEWNARWSGGLREAAVLVRDGKVLPQGEFACHVEHVSGGYELYRAEVEDGDVVLFLYRSGSGRTKSATPLFPKKGKPYYSWDMAEQALGLPEGSLAEVFWGD